MNDQPHLYLARYCLEKARNKIISAKILLEKHQYEDSMSRSYYAMFSAARALLATKHSGVISLFNQHFVKAGIVEKKMGKLLMTAKEIREKSDYGDYIKVNKMLLNSFNGKTSLAGGKSSSFIFMF